MNEKPSNNEFIKSSEEVSWRDLGEYAHEILIKQGENHPIEKCETLVDYSWYDNETGDNLKLRAASIGPETEYMLEIIDGSLIDHRRRYSFSGHVPGVQVFDDEYRRMAEEEYAQKLLETYVMQRLDTTQLARPETSQEGRQRFWNIAARYAIDSVVSEHLMNQLARHKEGSLKNLFRENIVDIIVAQNEYKYIPKSNVYGALIQKGTDIMVSMSQKQLEIKKED
jgi:hypothetical protein